MGRKKKILAGICVLCLLVLNVLIVCHRGSVGGNYELHLTMNSDKAVSYTHLTLPTKRIV